MSPSKGAWVINLDLFNIWLFCEFPLVYYWELVFYLVLHAVEFLIFLLPYDVTSDNQNPDVWAGIINCQLRKEKTPQLLRAIKVLPDNKFAQNFDFGVVTQ